MRNNDMVWESLQYGSLPLNDHPIDTYNDNHGFGPFQSAFSPWEFADPASQIDNTWNAGNNTLTVGVPVNLLTLFEDRSMMTHNQVGPALAASLHTGRTGGWLHDMIAGLGEGVIGNGATGTQ